MLPIAIDQSVYVAVSINLDNKINIINFDSEFPPYSCAITDIQVINKPPCWHDYVLCGIYGVLQELNMTLKEGINMAILGRVPQAAGLSSSSALVCGSALAFLSSLHPSENLTLAKESAVAGVSLADLAQICASSEKFVGTQGGGMDQAASLLSTAGSAQLISFNPLKCELVTLPPGATFVVANSLTDVKKAATSHFNTRVLECKIATKILARENKLECRDIKNMADLQTRLGSKSFEEMISLVEKTFHVEAYSLAEVAEALGITVTDVKTQILGTYDVTSFYLRQRALHVFSEAKRVFDFKKICDDWKDGKLQSIGEFYHIFCNFSTNKFVVIGKMAKLSKLVNFTIYCAPAGRECE